MIKGIGIAHFYSIDHLYLQSLIPTSSGLYS